MSFCWPNNLWILPKHCALERNRLSEAPFWTFELSGRLPSVTGINCRSDPPCIDRSLPAHPCSSTCVSTTCFDPKFELRSCQLEIFFTNERPVDRAGLLGRYQSEVCLSECLAVHVISDTVTSADSRERFQQEIPSQTSVLIATINLHRNPFNIFVIVSRRKRKFRLRTFSRKEARNSLQNERI